MTKMIVLAGRLFNAAGSTVLEDQAVLVENGRVSKVGRRADFGDLTGDTEVVDARDRFVMPGLINVHVHLMFMYAVGPTDRHKGRSAADCAVHATRVAAVLLAQGITTARDMAGTHGVPLEMRRMIGEGQIPGPRIISCGLPIAISGGHASHLSTVADGADGFRKAARQQLELGADFVKVMASHDPWPMQGEEKTRPELTVEEMRAAFDVAHAWGKQAACHVMGSTAIERVIESGVDIIEHGQYLTPSLARRLVEKQVSFTPTMSSYDAQTMHPRFRRGERWASEHELLLEGHRTALANALEAGAKILNGTDSVGCYAEEVEMFRKAGMSAIDSLLTCTRWPAEALGIAGEIGTIAPGHRADLVVLDGDPLADAYALEKVVSVIKDGKQYDPDALTYAERLVDPDFDIRRLARHPESSAKPAAQVAVPS